MLDCEDQDISSSNYMLETSKPPTLSLEDSNLPIVTQYPASPDAFMDTFPMAELSGLNNTDLSFLDVFFPEDNQCNNTKAMDNFEHVESRGSPEINIPYDNWLSRNMDIAAESYDQLSTPCENVFDLSYSSVSSSVLSDASEPTHLIANSLSSVYAATSPPTEIESLECCGSSYAVGGNNEMPVEPTNQQNRLSSISDSDEIILIEEDKNIKEDKNLACKKYLHMRKQNNLASQRSRKLRKLKNTEMTEKLEKLQIENEQLKQLVVKMEKERDFIKNLLLEKISRR